MTKLPQVGSHELIRALERAGFALVAHQALGPLEQAVLVDRTWTAARERAG